MLDRKFNDYDYQWKEGELEHHQPLLTTPIVELQCPDLPKAYLEVISSLMRVTIVQSVMRTYSAVVDPIRKAAM